MNKRTSDGLARAYARLIRLAERRRARLKNENADGADVCEANTPSAQVGTVSAENREPSQRDILQHE